MHLNFAQGARKHIMLEWCPVSNQWTQLALDLPRLVEEQSGLVYDSLKSIQLCSYMLVRGAFTSDLKYIAQVGSQESPLRSCP